MDTRTRTRSDVAATIEATALAPGTSSDDVRRLCARAVAEGTRAVCVPLAHVRGAAWELGGAGPLVVTVAGFPGGEDPTDVKLAQVRGAAEHGADEVDVVLDHRRLAAGDAAGAAADLEAVVRAAHEVGVGLKVILETGALTPELITRACAIVLEEGADWVKTSTGFGPRGASVEDVLRMRSAVGGRARVKAAGGIRTWDEAVALLDAGADALGCSAVGEVLDGGPV